MKITPDIFAHLTHYLKGLADGRVMVLLEVRLSSFSRIEFHIFYDQGGYCNETLAESATWTLRSLLGDPCSPLQACVNPDPVYEFGNEVFFREKIFLGSSVKKTVACCKNVLKDYWQCLRIDPTEKSQAWIEEAKRKRFVVRMFLSL